MVEDVLPISCTADPAHSVYLFLCSLADGQARTYQKVEKKAR